MYRSFSFLIHLLLPGILFSQAIEIGPLLKKYKNEPYIYLLKSDEVSVLLKETGIPTIKSHVKEELLICSDGRRSIRSKKVRSTAQSKVEDLTAKLLVYDGKKHRSNNLTPTSPQVESAGGSVFYDDDEYFTIVFPEAKEGDIVRIEYDIVYSDPRYFGLFFFSDYVPVLKNYIKITSPKNEIKLKTKEFNYQHIVIRSSVDSTKKNMSAIWETDTVTAISDEPLDASFRKKASALLACIESYRTPTGFVKLSGSVENLFSWYSEFLKNVDTTPDPHIKNTTDSLVANVTNEADKVKSIYAWVQDKIAYVAYEDGMNGFIPRDASTVLSYKYGDCKDMANLVTRMCRSAGLPVYHAWIGTRDIPYQFSDFPSAFCSNHMIAVYISGKDTVFLDATGKNHPFGLPTAMIQGKEALINLGNNKFIIAKVPLTNNSLSVESDSVHFRIRNQNEIKGKGVYTLSGYEKLRFPTEILTASFEKQKQYIQKIVRKGNNKFRLDTFKIVEPKYHEPIRIYYEFSLPDYAIVSDNHLLLNMNFHNDYFDDLVSEDRKYAIDFQYKSTHKLFVSMDITETQKVDFIPNKLDLDNKIFRVNNEYHSNPKQISFNSTISMEQLTIPDEDFPELRTLLTRYKSQNSKLISISEKNN